MPFYEEVGIDLDGPEPQKIRINWKTCRVVPERELGPLSARHAQHDATPANFVGDFPQRPHSHAGSLDAILGSTARWSRAQTAAHPDLTNFSRSGVRHMKPRKFRQAPAPKHVPLKGSAAQAHASNSSPLILPGAKSGKTKQISAELKQISAERSAAGVDQMPEILQRLIAGDGVPDMILASAQLLRLVQGESADAASVRAAVGQYAGILRSLVKLIKLCQPPYQSHKPLVMKTLSQLAFYNKTNSDILSQEIAFMPQLIFAVFSGVIVLQLETARLINNIAASSIDAAQRLCSYPGMLEAIKRLCSASNFSVRFRAVSAVNCLARHALNCPKMGAALAKSEIVADLPESSLEEAGSEEKHRLYGFMRTCAQGNSMGSIERRTWAAEEYHLETAVLALKSACEGTKFAGVTCHVLPMLLSLRYVAVSEANKKTLFNKKLVDVLAEFVERWQEEPSEALGDQLQCLELAMTLLIALLTVDGKTVIKKALFQTEVKARLRALEFGASLFQTIKLRHSRQAVDLAQRLIDELQLRLDLEAQDSCEEYRSSTPEHLGQESLSSTCSSSRMIGTSRSIPRSPNPDWVHPLRAGAGGGPPAIPRPHTNAQTDIGEVESNFDCEFLYGSAAAHRTARDLLWDAPSRKKIVALCRKHILMNWKRLKAELEASAQTSDLENASGTVPSAHVYKILGGQRIWLEADEWQGFMDEYAMPETSPSRTSCSSKQASLHLSSLLSDLKHLLEQNPTALKGRGRPDNEPEVYNLDGEGNASPLLGASQGPKQRLQTCGPAVFKREPAERLAMLAGLLLKQIETDFSSLCEALSMEETVNIFKLQALLRSIGWVLTKTELERLRQTLGDADVEGGVPVGSFLHLVAEATARSHSGGETELVMQIARVERVLELTGEGVGSYHDDTALEKQKQKPWRRTLERRFQRDNDASACASRDSFTMAGGQVAHEDSRSSLSSN